MSSLPWDDDNEEKDDDEEEEDDEEEDETELARARAGDAQGEAGLRGGPRERAVCMWLFMYSRPLAYGGVAWE